MLKRSVMAAFAASWLVASGCVGLGFAGKAEAAVFGPTTVVSVGVFYDNLAPYGRWVDTAPYGWCWVPEQVPVVWRPYSDGYWVYTDFGWAWVSDEPWGWATYHYGRWFEDPDYGWMWEPGTEWAPAWVAWRESDDWVGWAPLPPTATWSAWSGLRFEAVSIPSPSWCFVQRTRMTEPTLSVAIASANRNVTLLSRTRDATHFALRSGRPVDEGVSLAAFERQTGQRVPRLRIVDAMAPQRGHGASNGAVAFYRPRVRTEPGTMPMSRAIEPRMNRPGFQPRGVGNQRVERSPIESARFQRQQEMMQRPQRPSPESIRQQRRAEPRTFEQPQRPSMESMRQQRQAQQQAFEQRQQQQRGRLREQSMRRQGPPPEQQQQQPERPQRGDQGGPPPQSAQRGDQGQGQPPQHAEHGHSQSQQSADRGNQDERKGRGHKNGRGG